MNQHGWVVDDEEQRGHRVEPHPGDDHRLAPDGVAQPPQRRREHEGAHVVGGGHHADQPDRSVSLLLQEHRQIRQYGPESRPDDEAGRADDPQLEPLGPFEASGRDPMTGSPTSLGRAVRS